MADDHLLRALLPGPNLRVVFVSAAHTAHEAARIHGCAPTAAWALAHAVAGASLVAALGKDGQRVTVQVSGEGPLRLVFADASADGRVKAYVGAPGVPPAPGRDPSDMVASFGRGAAFSVLRELPGGELYRGSLDLDRPRLDGMLARYFETSEQIPTALSIDVRGPTSSAPETVRGVLVQKLPGGDDEAVQVLREALSGGALAAAPADGSLPRLPGLEEVEVLERVPLAFRCTCSRERAEKGVIAAGAAELADMIEKDGGAVLTCEFCRTVYRFGADDLRALLERAQA